MSDITSARLVRYEILFSTPQPVALEDIQTIADKTLVGYWLGSGMGAWEGQREHAYSLVYVGNPASRSEIVGLCASLRDHYQQQTVMLLESDVTATFI